MSPTFLPSRSLEQISYDYAPIWGFALRRSDRLSFFLSFLYFDLYPFPFIGQKTNIYYSYIIPYLAVFVRRSVETQRVVVTLGSSSFDTSACDLSYKYIYHYFFSFLSPSVRLDHPELRSIRQNCTTGNPVTTRYSTPK